MIDTNINRRDKLLPSELMKAYSMKMEILKNYKGGQPVHNEGNSTESNKTREKSLSKKMFQADKLLDI